MKSRLLLAFLVLLLLAAAVLTARALHPFAAPPRPTGPPRLSFDVERVSLGRVGQGRAGSGADEIAIPWRREGRGLLRVLALETGCGCAVVSGLPDLLRECTTGRLVVRYVGGKRPGPLRLRVRAITDAPAGRDVTDVWITGFVDVPVRVRPARLRLGRRTAGGRVARTLVVTLADDLRAEVTARILGASGDVVVETGRDASSRVVHVRLDVPVRAGPWFAAIELDYGSPDVLAVPVEAEVVQPSGLPARARRMSGSSRGKMSKVQVPSATASGGP